MRRIPAIVALLLIVYLLALQGSLVQAGTVTLPGGWRADFIYCRNGYSAANIVVGSVASSTVTNNIVVNSISPSATGLGTIAIYSGTTIASGPRTFYWSLAQSPGTPVSASISRVENGVVVGTVTELGTIQDCNVTIPPPAPDSGPDNRINPDPIAPVAIYCRPNGVEILTIDGQGNGHFAFLATQNQINAVGIPSRNTLIAAGGGVGLFRLTSGEFQVNVPTFVTGGTTTSVQPQQPATTTTTSTMTTTAGNVVHVVQRGENLFRISLRYGVTMASIAALNGIANFNLIYAGQRLIIPARGSTPVTTTTSAVSSTPASAAAAQSFVSGQDYVFVWGGC
jgi:LysM repeat protein